MATRVKNHRRYESKYMEYFCECYSEKPFNVWLWRYGIYTMHRGEFKGRVIKDGLKTRPNMYKLFPQIIKFK